MFNGTRRLVVPLLVLLSLVALPRETVAQTGTATARASTVATVRVSTFGWKPGRLSSAARDRAGLRQSAARVGPRDSLTNGAIVGAAVGAVAFGALAAVICKAQQEPQGPSCVADTFRIAAIGAAIGVGAGLAIDAALTRNSGVAVSLGIKF